MKFDVKETLKKRSWRKLVIVVALLAFIVVVGVAQGVQYWYTSNIRPASNGKVVDVVVTVESGMNSKSIAQLLETKGVIKNSRAFTWYVSRHGFRAKLQAGTYKFSPTESVARITDKLVNGEVDTSYLTILSGKRIDEIKKSFSKAGFSDADIASSFNADLYRNHKALAGLPAGGSLEGYLYPETFKVSKAESVRDILDVSIQQLDEKLTPDLLAKLKARGFSVRQAITLASLVEKETSTLKDRPIVAQVFEKRLSLGMPLGSDVTFIYAAALSGEVATPSLDSPYNTRKVTGLPPGPISNFTVSSLSAIGDPSNTDYLYFVAGDDGEVHYAKTIDEHNNNIAKFCTKLCQ